MTSEWEYVIFERSTTSGIRFAKAQVNNMDGLILLPDNWNSSHYNLNSTDIEEAPFSSNVISSSIWTASFEAYGAVFLPAGGQRQETSIILGNGYYWSSSFYTYMTPSSTSNGEYAYDLNFSNNSLNSTTLDTRSTGKAVRLVQDY